MSRLPNCCAPIEVLRAGTILGDLRADPQGRLGFSGLSIRARVRGDPNSREPTVRESVRVALATLAE